MRRIGIAPLCLALLTPLAATLDPCETEAQPFGFLFGQPPPRARTYRPRRRPPPVAAIPLPVPRPHFLGDRSPAPPPETAGQTPDSTPPAVPRAPPLPPGKPEAVKPETPKATGAVKQTETGKPGKAADGASEEQSRKATEPPQVHGPPAPPAKPAEIAKPEPRPGESGPSKPPVAASGASTTTTPRSPNDDPACPGRLKARDVTAEPTVVGPQPDERCTVIEAVRLAGLTLADGGKVDFPDRPTLACATADAFSLYVRDLLVPLARGTFGSPVAAVWTGPGLECRSRDHVFGAKLSAHGQGLAVDIARLKLGDGRIIAVGEPKTDLETGFEAASRAGGCGYFHTALGPGSDSYHRTHWHFDLEVRGSSGDGKYCK